ncbi:bifunctional nicotinamide-nucleotide adenylyltransferase/Nudix hydroxylase [Chitiniphilus purpureus]|uniref:Bifunctional nicotinamide-nucleotide adenylyltransferase/Nudix hydroxylase n=1 Tax=Chitiniphilus purpureus TaxID=2981137 RepID=A0ABY6DRF2_9NEIS|nr:bifunctional nicotinamide-nucleotide adenylyltransferase/Nudix hydroxylase [Chitiniphilus sp. CD1]UXY16803.1 bifunctional nicotinamide-nucleotide adenylyltransferase/Nudix hydroxylase [Chitiniphilus sp. CD1]
MKYDYLVFIGRFQPVHLGHLQVIEAALGLSHKLIVICGSARQARSPRNPFTLAEREAMLRAALPPAWQSRVFMVGCSDRMYNDQQWITEVQNLVDKVIAVDTASLGHRAAEFRVGIVGAGGGSPARQVHYLELFPQWQREQAAEWPGVDAATLREALFAQQGAHFAGCRDKLPTAVYEWLHRFRELPVYAQIAAEHDYLQSFRRAWADTPHPPTFVTVDAVVIHSGHVLLVKRRSLPGRGLWALPGGFVAQDEPIRDAVIRELKEEARLKVPAPVLAGSIRASRVFDHPQRSLRGRTITHAFLIELAPTGEGLPKVRGGDDSDRAQWVPLFEFNRMEEQLFEDHFYIVNWFLGQI